MEKREKTKVCKIYLTGWQKRMIWEFMSEKEKEIFRLRNEPPFMMKLEYREPDCPASYKIPPEGMRIGDYVVFLSDAQIAQVQEELQLKAPISEINVSEMAIKAGNVQFFA